MRIQHLKTKIYDSNSISNSIQAYRNTAVLQYPLFCTIFCS